MTFAQSRFSWPARSSRPSCCSRARRCRARRPADDGAYQLLGRVFPDPQGAATPGPARRGRRATCRPRRFLGYQEFIDGLKYMNSDRRQRQDLAALPRGLDARRRPGRQQQADDRRHRPGTDEKANFPGNNLGFWEFTPDGQAHSAGLPMPTWAASRPTSSSSRVTDENVPDAASSAIALSLSIHGIERAGVEGGARALEDLVTAATTGKLDKPILTTKGLGMPIPTFKEVLQKTIIYFTFPNPDGWRRGDSTDTEKGPGVFFQRYNGNGVDVNRDFPDIGFSFRPYCVALRARDAAAGQRRSSRSRHARRPVRRRRRPARPARRGLVLVHADAARLARLRQERAHPRGRPDASTSSSRRAGWSPLIQPNDQPRGSCNNKPVVGADCYPMYGQSWGTVYDTINYTTTGALGDFMDSSIGLNADGIDNEMSYSHLDKDIAFEPLIEQMHVDGNMGLIYAHVAQVLNAAHVRLPRTRPQGLRAHRARQGRRRPRQHDARRRAPMPRPTSTTTSRPRRERDVRVRRSRTATASTTAACGSTSRRRTSRASTRARRPASAWLVAVLGLRPAPRRAGRRRQGVDHGGRGLQPDRASTSRPA